ncbi:probable E3 SUMO-protein ligase RNF212 isoform X3 [Notechis scutatus]|uniref:Probable E3 SUMO-protein ligase RNF212 isoform X3 n=1 Tax=Notechis scutatus TaxID=8663 RepID=A0A6J1UZJ0_9SAUR|nr:probable E3 SUMO-protein ligase RNF212 isoform X3 [Notechis scutatus]XP_026536423.1 probable E3 SUMO-protein ligase RNF212 isoform X3 [Notechis scutatus]XP_026536432.1 probable E3 SUMO-protein ligase RNF212 isoform X3 [Notechis scutatus]
MYDLQSSVSYNSPFKKGEFRYPVTLYGIRWVMQKIFQRNHTNCPVSGKTQKTSVNTLQRKDCSIQIKKLEAYLKRASQQIQHIQQLQHRNSSKEVEVPPSIRKTETVAGPTRISLISPPQNGHMGSVTCRSSQLSGMTTFQRNPTGSTRSSPLKMVNSGNSYISPFVSSQNNRNHIPNTFGQKSTQHYQSTPASLLSSGIKHPITLVNLLQRQHLGK